ncbi:uncharacterized membrane protein [Candidatus Scalindua japonica]|uniref:Uncharacterized membrane protein n=1 Tax=Candidatus Scalindua japonica TaxID=1284222 RepID=A0A286TTI4_9BACT|nr:oligosaccharide flippase family protein [Candidatus Scalindua japonica]GAX59186.1 uncharacterized membrane protein [Candidatus Scalindua japonica]
MSKSYLAKGSFFLFAGMVFNMVIGYVNTVLVLGFVEVSLYGTIIFLITIMEVIAAISRQGMHVAVTKYISEYVGKGDKGTAKKIFNDSKWFVIFVAIVLTVVSPFIYKLLLPHKIISHISYPLFLICFIPCVFLNPLLILNQNGFMGLRLSALSSITGFFLQPVFRIICILSILAILPTITGLIYVQIVPLVLAYLISEILINNKDFGFTLPSFKHTKLLYKFSAPLIGTELLMLSIDKMDKVFLGYMATTESVGIYNVASKIAFIVVIPFWAGAQVLAPLFSEYWSKNQIKQLNEIYKYSSYLFLFIAGSVVIFLWINIKLILGVFGEQFVNNEAVVVTTILSLSLFLTILPGCFSQLIRMSGKTYLSTINTFLIGSLNFVLNYFLIPEYGMLGAAIATATAVLCGHLNGFIILKFIYKGTVSPFSYNYFLVLATISGVSILVYYSPNLILDNVLAFFIMSLIGYVMFRSELSKVMVKLRARINL